LRDDRAGLQVRDVLDERADAAAQVTQLVGQQRRDELSGGQMIASLSGVEATTV
jgi:hypothetical protein